MTKITQVPQASGIDLYAIPKAAELEQEQASHEVANKIKARIQEAQQSTEQPTEQPRNNLGINAGQYYGYDQFSTTYSEIQPPNIEEK